ncbi:anthranilate phosphoribosyltransferase [Clavibacter tessellarius]|uniref:anthranilate phosphoribosyltransferase n=1 Tax=Clavibacter tessellarius TaxID=31965 RepID=UPI0032519CC9
MLNISSAASVIAAAAGVPVIKHGNRGASSASGASDVLTALGVDLTITPGRVGEVLRETGITYAHAALFHPGFRHAAATRRELGISTLFNVLGPLCNPARPEASAVGVADLSRVPLMVGVFRTRGATALVYRGDDGIDKLTTTGHSHIWEVSRGAVTEHDLDPLEPRHPARAGGGPPRRGDRGERRRHPAGAGGEPGPQRDVVLLNAAAGLEAFDLMGDPTRVQQPMARRLREKLLVAAGAVDSGRAAAKLEEWAAATRA